MHCSYELVESDIVIFGHTNRFLLTSVFYQIIVMLYRYFLKICFISVFLL